MNVLGKPCPERVLCFELNAGNEGFDCTGDFRSESGFVGFSGRSKSIG